MTVLVTGGTGFVAGWTISELLRQGFSWASQVPSRNLPDFVLKASRVLGWEPRPARESVVDCAESLTQRAS